MPTHRPIPEHFLRRPGLCARALLCILLLFVPLLRAAELPNEYQIKAVYLLNFTKFVEWPATAFETPESPIVICVVGDNPFGGILNQLVEGETVNNRRVTVQRYQRPPKPGNCHVAFFSGQPKESPATLTALGPGVLTVGEHDGFLRDGGIIAFVLEGRHVRFDINQRAAQRAALSLSARLLNVARSVQR